MGRMCVGQSVAGARPPRECDICRFVIAVVAQSGGRKMAKKGEYSD